MTLMLTLTLLAVLSSASCYNFKWSTIFSHFSRGHTIQTLCCRKQSTTLWSMAQQISGNDGEEGSASKLIGGLMSQSSQNHVVDALKRGKDELSRDHRDNNITTVQALKVLRESMNSLVNQMRGEKETVRSKLLTRRIDIWQRQLATKFLEAEMLALNETFRAAMNETLQPAMYTHVLHEKAIIRLVRALRDARKGRRVGFGDDIVTTSVVNLEGSVPDWGRFIIDSDEEKWERGTLNAGGKADRQRYEEQQKKKEEVKHAAEHFERKSKDINTMEEFIAACDELKSQAGPDGLSIQPMLIATDCKDRDGRPATKFFIYIASVQ